LCICLLFSWYRNIFNHRTQLELWVTDVSSSSKFLCYVTWPISATADVFCHIMHFSSSTWFRFASTYVQPSTVKILPHFILHSGTPTHPGTSRPICRAICRSGQQCRISATLGSDVCRRHNLDSSFHWYCKGQKPGLCSRGLYSVLTW
jgi:hypothetical protein